MLDYLKGDITPEDRQRMTELLHKDASCREKYREMSRAYAIASVPWFERRKKQNLDFLREKLDLRSSPGRTLVRRVRVGSFAAMVALLIGLGIRFIYLNNHPAEVIVPPVSYCRIEIPQGAQSKLILPDSTSVYLNGGTIIKYDASFQNKAEREVYLNGEAYFEVAKNAEKPFIVHAADLNVKAGRKRNMPRMSKKRKHELSFYLNDRGRVTYNELCRKCQHGCRQSFRAVVVDCPRYLSKRARKKEEDTE